MDHAKRPPPYGADQTSLPFSSDIHAVGPYLTTASPTRSWPFWSLIPSPAPFLSSESSARVLPFSPNSTSPAPSLPTASSARVLPFSSSTMNRLARISFTPDCGHAVSGVKVFKMNQTAKTRTMQAIRQRLTHLTPHFPY